MRDNWHATDLYLFLSFFLIINATCTGMDMGDSSQATQKEKKSNRRIWTKEEEEALLSVLEDIVASGGRLDCGSFKSGTFKTMEVRLAQILPNCGLKANPHIESKVKNWKRDYGVIFDMRNTSGFGWNNEKHCIEVDNEETWNAYVEVILYVFTLLFILIFELN